VQVGRGYLGQPERTAERFVPDPQGAPSGALLYRTGDLARHLPDGAIEYLGRIDHQVKLRGFRIELGEVEAVLLHHPEVRDAAAAVRQDMPGGPQLVAYVVAREGEGTELPRRLPDFLARHLPPYMIPATIVVLPALPLSPNGKVERRALPAPDRPASRAGVEPRTPIETVVAGLFAELLGHERVGVTDSFFQLGGHSLLAAQLLARVRGLFGLDLPLRRLFETPTVAAVAAAIVAGEPQPGQSEKIAKVVLLARKKAAERSAREALKEERGSSGVGTVP
jgi:acyl carrier protein